MNTNAIAMDPETSPILTTLAEWWKEFLAAGGVGAILAFLKARKISVWKIAKAIFGWFRAAVMLPIRLEGIESTCTDLRTQLAMKDGKGLSNWAEGVDHTLIGLRRTLSLETSLRRVSMQSLPDSIFEADRDGQFQWVNTAFLEKAGVRIDDVRGNNWWNIIALPDRDELVDAWYKQVSLGNHFRGKFRLNTAGPDRWMMFDATCNRDDLAQVLGYLGYLREIADPRGQKSV